MPIIEKSQSEEEIQQVNKTGAEKRQSLADKIKGGDVFKSIEIPTGEPEEQPEEEVSQETEEEQAENTESEEVEQESEDEEADNLDEMIPRSKVDKRFAKLTSELKAKEAELESLRVNRASEEKPVDEQTTKLQKMSDEELKTLRREVRAAQLDSKDDKAKLKDLLDLEDKIDDVRRSAPVRFTQAQVSAYNKMADKIAVGYTPKEVEEAAPKIVAMAKDIYQRYPKLQSDVEGQAIALEIAADKYKELSKHSYANGTVKNLKSQVNTLKRKTSLENATSKSTGDPNVEAQLKASAMSGNRRSKEAFVRDSKMFNVDAMIPAEYK